MYTCINFNSQVKSGISKFPDLMNAPRKQMRMKAFIIQSKKKVGARAHM